jgi:hypothetical protein
MGWQLHCHPSGQSGAAVQLPSQHMVIIADLRTVQKAESTQSSILATRPPHRHIKQIPQALHLAKKYLRADSPDYGIVTIGTSAAADEFFPGMGEGRKKDRLSGSRSEQAGLS